MMSQDDLAIWVGEVCLAIVCIAVPLLVLYLERSKRDRLAKWRAIGLTQQWRTWDAVAALGESLAGEHRGRGLTMSFLSSQEDYWGDDGAKVTRVRLAVTSPPGSRLAIIPRRGAWPTWLFRNDVPHTDVIEDHFRIQCDPPDLAARVVAIPRISAILLSDPKPAVVLEGNELLFERRGYFPDPQDAADLFDMLCDLADASETVAA